MHQERGLIYKRFSILIGWIIWGALFAAAYSQAPLYTSNQNQYFLHGLARAGLGDLRTDWLVNTLDPTPVFSLLVEWTYRLIPWPELFYGYYAVLLGAYLYGLYQVVNKLFDLDGSKLRGLLFLCSAIFVHSAGLRFGLSRLLGDNWTYVLEDGVADQRLLGSVLQPSAFGVFLLLSVAAFLNHRLLAAAILAALAAVFHPTYLFSAGIFTAVYLLLAWRTDRSLRRVLPAGLAALGMAVPVLVYTYVVFAGGEPEAAAQARHILVTYRIPHHAVIGWWLDGTVAFKALIVLAALWLARRTALFPILFSTAAAAVAFTALQSVSGNEALALLFPWRITVFVVPLSSSVLLGWGVSRLESARLMLLPVVHTAVVAGALILAAAAVTVGLLRFRLDLQRKAADPERLVQAYVASSRRPGEVYLTPVKMQDFRLASGAAVYVDFKSIPYNSLDVLEWRARIRLADAIYASPTCELLYQATASGKVSHLVWPSLLGLPDCPAWQETYQDAEYSIYQLTAGDGTAP